MSDDIRESARRWAQTWQASWPAHDIAAITALYAPEAHFQPHPFRPALPVTRYLNEVFVDEVTAEASFDEPIVDGDRAAVHWKARTELRSGKAEDLVGVSLLVFTAAGLVAEQRDFWADGAVE
jgi:hypothetical protein